ncbi:hypothetical protein ACEN2J_14440 [Pseudorhodobacter sp. W20_MBD10_FR17]|uniref:hypothetical protein n=1 Tax=Pseudorhodobacter sp. W20_MBD10_FR17 TaxID=3240266 RepID=UPI003F9A9526
MFDPNNEQEAPPLFEASCHTAELLKGEQIWEDIRLKLVAEAHPASSQVWMVKLFYEDQKQQDIVPHLIGNYLRLREISFGASKIADFTVGVKKAKKLTWKLALGNGLDFGRMEDSDLQSDRGREFLSEIETLRDLMEEARIALVGAEMVADRLRKLSQGDKRIGLDAALLGHPLETMARQLAQIWIGCGLTLDGGRSGDGLDEVIVRIVESISGQKDRGPQTWLKELMTKLRKS